MNVVLLQDLGPERGLSAQYHICRNNPRKITKLWLLWYWEPPALCLLLITYISITNNYSKETPT